VSLFSNFSSDCILRPEVILHQGGIECFLVSSETKEHWQAGLGTLRWGEYDHGASWYLSREIKAGEKAERVDRIYWYYPALLLLGPSLSSQNDLSLFSVSGENLPKLRISDIDGVVNLKGWSCGAYLEKPEFMRWFLELDNDNILEDWQRLYTQILETEIAGNAYYQVRLAIYCFMNAMHTRNLDFRIPDLVRAIDCLVTTKHGEGKTQFKSRSKHFLRHSQLLPYFAIGESEQAELLGQIYDLRSGSVHGNRFAENLKRSGVNDLNSMIFKYELVLEEVVREIIKRFLGSAELKNYCTDRETLLEAWQSGLVEQHL